MIHKKMPDDFQPRFSAVGCFLEHDGKILLLHRQDSSPEGNTWGLASGKIEENEDVFEAILREILEETGLRLLLHQVCFLERVYVRYPDYDFIYHVFRAVLDEGQEIAINPGEHKDFRWVSPEEALEMELIGDLGGCIRLFYKI